MRVSSLTLRYYLVAKIRDSRAQTLASLQKNATLFLKSLAFRVRYFTGAEERAEFRPLEMDAQRFPPLDHGGVASAFFI